MAVVLAVERKIQFYTSQNLREWKLMSAFGPAGDTTGVWECPDLFEVPVANEPGKTKWVLMHSPAPYMQYFIGDFDGTSFHSENPANKIYRPDFGPDYYAAIVYNNLPAGSAPVSIGWVNNWNYANDIPTMPWRGAMSLPRNLSVKKVGAEWILLQQPVAMLQRQRMNPAQWQNLQVEGIKLLPVKGQQFEIDLLLDIGSSAKCGIQVAAGGGNLMEIGYDAITKRLYIDRSKTTYQSFNKNFEKQNRYETPLILANNHLRLHIYFDNSIVEVFANEGEVVLTTQIFPDQSDSGIQLFSTRGKAIANEVKFWMLKSIW
jgi:fructan beta-fructosidase